MICLILSGFLFNGVDGTTAKITALGREQLLSDAAPSPE